MAIASALVGVRLLLLTHEHFTALASAKVNRVIRLVLAACHGAR